MNARPFKVINCLSQGFAVAGPVEGSEKSEGGGQKAEGIDFEMVVWGMAMDRAIAMAAELNGENGGSAPAGPLHRRD